MKSRFHVGLLSLFLLVLAALPGRAVITSTQQTFVLSNEAPGGLITKLVAAGYGDNNVYEALVVIPQSTNPSVAGVITPAFLAALNSCPPTSEIFTIQLKNVSGTVAISTDGTVRTVSLQGSAFNGQPGTTTLATNISGVGSASFVSSTSASPLTSWTVPGGSVTTTYNVFAVAWAPVDSPPSCSYAISTADLSVVAAGGTMVLSIHTGSGCAWSITGLASWLTASGRSQGTGSANVTLVATASSGAPRTSIFSVGGVSVPVRQLDSSACAGSASCTTEVLTHVAFGGQWTTDLVAISSEANAGSFSVGFHGDSGAAIALPFTGGLGDLSTLADTVPTQGRKDYEATNPVYADQGGWGLVTADESLTLQALFRRHTADGMFYEAAVPTHEGYSRFIVPFDATNFAPTGAPMYTGFAIANLNPSATAHIDCTARDQYGVAVPNAVSIPALSALGHYTGFSFPVLAGKRGTFDCAADTLVSALALRAIGGDAISTLPVIVK